MKTLTKKKPKKPCVEEVNAGATGVPSMLVGDIAVAYAFVKNERNASLVHLLKLRIENDRVVAVEKDTEDLLGIKLARMHDDAMRDI